MYGCSCSHRPYYSFRISRIQSQKATRCQHLEIAIVHDDSRPRLSSENRRAPSTFPRPTAPREKKVVFHSCHWDSLTEDQKTEQIIALRMKLKYKHDPEKEKATKLRQKSYGYPGCAGFTADRSTDFFYHKDDGCHF